MLDEMPMPEAVRAAFDAMPKAVCAALLDTRGEILSDAARLDVGPLTEALKWGQPAYLTEASKAGTTIRLGVLGGQPAVFVHCQTTIIEAARELFGGVATFSGNRALILGGDARAVSYVIGAALTYHRPR